MGDRAAIYNAIALIILLKVQLPSGNIWELWGEYFAKHEWSPNGENGSTKYFTYNTEMGGTFAGENGEGELKKIPVLQSVRSHVYGRYYLRGFPKGGLGSRLFPVISKGGDSGVVHMINHPEFRKSAQASFKLFINKVAEYYCSGDKCCQPPGADCKANDKRTAVVQMLAEPTQSLQVIFLYRWCTQVWEEFRECPKTTKCRLFIRTARRTFGYLSGMRASPASSKINKTAESKSQCSRSEPGKIWPNPPLKAYEEELKASKEDYADKDRYCPDPCHGNPCARTFGVLNKRKCEVVGPFEDSYKCECVDGRKWDPVTLQCLLYNPCANTNPPLCVKANTRKCVARHDGTVGCICKKEFMGEDCSLPRDACLERINKSQPNGNTNCQIVYGNECKPILGTDYYTCICKYGFLPNRSLSEDNCQERRDPCIDYYVGQTLVQRAVTCLNGGHCISSEDFTRAFCICPKSADGSPMFEGPNCEIPIGVWSAWSSPTECLPKTCGATRYRWRRRRCLNVTTSAGLVNASIIPRKDFAKIHTKYHPPLRCAGTSEEVITCEPLPHCSVIRLPGYMREEILNYDTLYYFGILTVVMVILSLLIWYVFATPLLEAFSRSNYRPVIGES